MHPARATAWRLGRSAVAVAFLSLTIVVSACQQAPPAQAPPAQAPPAHAPPAQAATAPQPAGPVPATQQPFGQEATTRTVRGLLTDVQAASIAILREVELRSEDGQMLRFVIEGDTGITPGHARDHMVNAEPVTISYRTTRDGLVALRIDD